MDDKKKLSMISKATDILWNMLYIYLYIGARNLVYVSVCLNRYCSPNDQGLCALLNPQLKAVFLSLKGSRTSYRSMMRQQANFLV